MHECNWNFWKYTYIASYLYIKIFTGDRLQTQKEGNNASNSTTSPYLMKFVFCRSKAADFASNLRILVLWITIHLSVVFFFAAH